MSTIQEIRSHNAAVEKERIIGSLRRNGGNVSAAARSLGISRYALMRKMRKHGVSGQAPAVDDAGAST